MFSADRFIFGASNLAKYTRISPLVIGLSVISIGNSMPELCITIISAIENVPQIAVGALIGSNIAHVSLVIGITACLRPIEISKNLKYSDLFLFFSSAAIASILLLDLKLTKIKGIILVAIFLISFSWIILQEILSIRKKSKDNIYIDYNQKQEHLNKKNKKILIATAWLIFGIILLPFSCHYVVKNAQYIAIKLEITNLTVGLLLLGIGTNLPELAVMLTGIYHKEKDLAIGSILGANIFGITAALGLSGIFSPTTLPEIFRQRDLTSMMVLTLIFCLILLNPKKIISRLIGLILLCCYGAYVFITTL